MQSLLNELDAAIMSVDTDFDDNASVSVQFSAGQWQKIKRLVADAKRVNASLSVLTSFGLTQETEDNFRRLIDDQIARYVGDHAGDNAALADPVAFSPIEDQAVHFDEVNDDSDPSLIITEDAVHPVHNEQPQVIGELAALDPTVSDPAIVPPIEQIHSPD